MIGLAVTAGSIDLKKPFAVIVVVLDIAIVAVDDCYGKYH